VIGAAPSMVGADSLARARWQTVLAHASAIDFEQLDVDHHFGPCLVDGGNQPPAAAHAFRACP
jgi:hypothetical protein